VKDVLHVLPHAIREVLRPSETRETT
jgi:hypothetical protein